MYVRLLNLPLLTQYLCISASFQPSILTAAESGGGALNKNGL